MPRKSKATTQESKPTAQIINLMECRFFYECREGRIADSISIPASAGAEMVRVGIKAVKRKFQPPSGTALELFRVSDAKGNVVNEWKRTL